MPHSSPVQCGRLDLNPSPSAYALINIYKCSTCKNHISIWQMSCGWALIKAYKINIKGMAPFISGLDGKKHFWYIYLLWLHTLINASSMQLHQRWKNAFNHPIISTIIIYDRLITLIRMHQHNLIPFINCLTCDHHLEVNKLTCGHYPNVSLQIICLSSAATTLLAPGQQLWQHKVLT